MEALEIRRNNGNLLLNTQFGVLTVKKKEPMKAGSNLYYLQDPYVFAITYCGSVVNDLKISNNQGYNNKPFNAAADSVYINLNNADNMYLYHIGYAGLSVRQHGCGLQLFDENGALTYDSINRPVSFTSINNTNINSGANDLSKAIIINTPVMRNVVDKYIGYIYTKNGNFNAMVFDARYSPAIFSMPTVVNFHVVDVSGI